MYELSAFVPRTASHLKLYGASDVHVDEYDVAGCCAAEVIQDVHTRPVRCADAPVGITAENEDDDEIANQAKPIELSILLVDDERMQELNEEYRGVDKPTDVLAFEMVMPDLDFVRPRCQQWQCLLALDDCMQCD